MGAALMGFPQVAVLGADVALHGLAHNQVTLILERSVREAVTFCPKLCLDKGRTPFLQELEEGTVLHNGHLDYLGDAVAEPPAMEAPPHAAVRDGEDWGMVRTVQILVVEAVAACPG
jgi:hypothetical protein